MNIHHLSFAVCAVVLAGGVQAGTLSCGNTVVETLFPGTHHEMVPVYHDQDGKPGLTHYCAMKNRPNLSMVNSTSDSIYFDYAESEGINVDKDAHMHAESINKVSFTVKPQINRGLQKIYAPCAVFFACN